jgi:TonB family protein
MEKVFVSGGSGFISLHLISKLIQEGYQVRTSLRSLDRKQEVIDAVVIQGYPNTGLNESALEAVKKTKFSPARQNNNRVGVWYTIPIKYTLNQ